MVDVTAVVVLSGGVVVAVVNDALVQVFGGVVVVGEWWCGGHSD